jgi:hypothetical protein
LPERFYAWSVSEAASTDEWVHTMAERYKWRDPEAVRAQFAGTTVEDREGVQYVFEKLFFEGKLNYLYE